MLEGETNRHESFDARSAWNQLAAGYEYHRTLSDSLDTLLEWPAQIDFVGDVKNQSILDIGCGSGIKAKHFADHGASLVLGLDVSDEFIDAWKTKAKPPNLRFVQCDINALEDCGTLRGQQFDLILCFQVMGYAHDEYRAFRSMRALLNDSGAIIMMGSSPLRMKKQVQDGTVTKLDSGDVNLVRYASRWNPSVTLQHRTSTLSERLNAIADSGLYIARSCEPEFPPQLRDRFPEKARWWDEHGGVILYRIQVRKNA